MENPTMPLSRIVSAGTLVFFAAAAGAAAEEVDHPAYLSWAQRPVGTAVTLRSLTVCGSNTITTTTTTTLKQLKPDRAVLEIRRKSDATGTRVENAPEIYEQRRKFPLFPGVRKEDIGKPLKPIEQGAETLKLAGQEFKTVWFDSRTKGDGGLDWHIRTWMSEDVPGRLVKSVTRIPEAATTITVELIALSSP
jgi:hypothetical protein